MHVQWDSAEKRGKGDRKGYRVQVKEADFGSVSEIRKALKNFEFRSKTVFYFVLEVISSSIRFHFHSISEINCKVGS